jgi:Na+/H+ antiporter NhaD/arsenite permease-like protein
MVLAIFYAVDTVLARREPAREGAAEETPEQPLHVVGASGFLFLLGVVAAIYASGRFGLPPGAQEGAMVLMAALSLALSPREARAENRFGWGPIVEVAVLFAGIFVTMVPALMILNARGPELGLTRPWQLFWATGVLSSFLDNAPTYLTFAATVCGTMGVSVDSPGYLGRLLAQGPAAHAALAAVATGAVFMGANTYIGNGPNFMVKAIAEEAGVKMPSFFGYMAWSIAILIPTFIAVTFLFFT